MGDQEGKKYSPFPHWYTRAVPKSLLNFCYFVGIQSAHGLKRHAFEFKTVGHPGTETHVTTNQVGALVHTCMDKVGLQECPCAQPNPDIHHNNIGGRKQQERCIEHQEQRQFICKEASR